MLSEKVVRINENELTDQIERFIFTVGRNSVATGKSYLKDIKRFFEIIKGKDVKFLTRKDVQLSLNDFIDFVRYMSENTKLDSKTINHNVTSVKELILHLSSVTDSDNNYFVEDVRFIPQLSKIRLKENKNSHGALYKDEVAKMAELALLEKDKPEIKHRLIKFAFDTLVRKEACLNIKWTDFEKKDEEYLIRGVDKGSKDFKVRISKEFYNHLLEIKTCDNEYVFPIGKGSIDNMMDRLRDKMNIPKERNIVFHSLRKAGAIHLFNETGDIRKVQAALNHSNINTTVIYLEDETVGMLGAISSGGGVNTERYKDISHEDLLKAISLLPQSAKFNLALKIKEVVNITENN